MIERFDHAVIGVPDLEAAMETFGRLGFEVAEGGRHPSLGTRNAIVRFGLDYLELLTVEHPDTARSRGAFGADLVDFLARDSGPVGYVLAGARLAEEADGLRALGLEVEGPFEMDRIHTRGGRIEWRLLLPGASPWRKPWPYLIDWVTPAGELLAWDPPGSHECGVTRMVGIDLVVEDVTEAAILYEDGLGLRSGAGRPRPDARSRYYELGDFLLGVHQPVCAGGLSAELNRRGPGPCRLILASEDLGRTGRILAARRVRYDRSSEGIDVHPEEASGARIRIIPG